MDSIPFFPKFVTYAPMVAAVVFFMFSFSKKQYESWDKNFGEKKARKILMFMRYIAPPILIIGGLIQLLL